MKEFFLITLFLVVNQIVGEPVCSSEQDLSVYPNPANCSTYYKCWGGIAFLLECPPGLHWSVELSKCERPEVAKCHETETPLVLIFCPPGQQWNKENYTCEYPKVALPAVTRDNKCPAEDGYEDILLPNPWDCGSFFKCSGGKPVLQYCPPGLKWSVAYNRCEYPEIAKCVETEEKPPSTPSTTTVTTSVKPPSERPDHCPAEDTDEDVLLPNPADCTTFYKCLAGEPHLIFCPVGLHWSVELNRCEYPEIAKCQTKRLFDVFLYKAESECPENNSGFDILYPNPEDCYTYYQCVNGVKVLKKCPKGTRWDVPMNRCDHISFARCP